MSNEKGIRVGHPGPTICLFQANWIKFNLWWLFQSAMSMPPWWPFETPAAYRETECSQPLNNCFSSASEQWLHATTIQSSSLSISRRHAESHQTIIWLSSPAALGHDDQLMRSVKDTEVFSWCHFFWLCPSQWCSSTTPKKVWEAELENVTFKMNVIILC